VTEIDEGVNDEMCAHEMSRFAVKAHQQGTKIVDPGKQLKRSL